MQQNSTLCAIFSIRVIYLTKYKLILFDADGTLFDYDMAEGIALQKAFEHHQLNYCNDVRNIYREINSQMWKEFENGKIDKPSFQINRFKNLFKECNLTADSEGFSSIYLDFLAESGHLIDGAMEVCRELSQYSTLAIATNGIARTQKGRLKNSDIEPYISYIIVSEDAGYQKPHQGFFQYALSKCRIEGKENVIIVGDSLSTDIKGGSDFGIDTCWYNPSGIIDNSGMNINYEIKDLSDLVGLILR